MVGVSVQSGVADFGSAMAVSQTNPSRQPLRVCETANGIGKVMRRQEVVTPHDAAEIECESESLD